MAARVVQHPSSVILNPKTMVDRCHQNRLSQALLLDRPLTKVLVAWFAVPAEAVVQSGHYLGAKLRLPLFQSLAVASSSQKCLQVAIDLSFCLCTILLTS